jgi:hypothetical protein
MMDTVKILSDLQNNYKASLVSKTKVDSSIQKWVKAYNGQKYGNEVKGRSEIVMKDIKKTIKTMSPSIIEPFVSSDTLINAKAVRVGTENIASYNSDILNYQYNNQFDKLEFITSISMILPKEGTVFVRTGWDFKEEVEKKELKGLGFDELQIVQQTMAQDVKNVVQEKDGSFTVSLEKRKTIKNNPTAVICKNESITTDPTAQSFKDSKFITYEYEKSYSDIKKESNIYDYQPITSEMLEQSGTSRYPETALGGQRAIDNYNSGVDYHFNFSEKSSRKVRIIEYWGEYDLDGSGTNQQIVCAWIKNTDTILRLDKNPYPDNSIPFVSCQYGFEPFTVWGMGLGDILGDGQQIHTAIMRGFIDNMSLSNNGQKFFQKGAIDYINLGKLQRGEKYIELNNLNGMTDGTYNQIPSSSFNVYDMITKENELLSGANSQMEGIDSATIGRTASGVNQVMGAAQRHMVVIVRIIAEMYKDMFTKWASYNSEFLDDEQAFEIAGQLAGLDKDKLSGDINIEMNINLDSMNSQKLQQINMLLQQSQTLGQAVPPMVIPLLVAEIFEGFGKYEYAKQIREYQPEPDPMQQQIQQLEMQKLQMEIAKLQAEVELTQAKAVESESKAIESQSRADNTDMNTLSKPKETALAEAEFKHNAIENYLDRQSGRSNASD